MGSGHGGGGGGSILRTIHRAVRTANVGGGAINEPFLNATNSTIRTTTRKQTSQNKSNAIKLNSSSSTPSSGRSNSSPFSSHNTPISSAPSWPENSSTPCTEEADEWEHIDGSGDERAHGHAYFDDDLFGTVPSVDEVHHAVSALQQVFGPTSFSLSKDAIAYHSDKEGDTASSVGSDSDWIEPSFCNPEALKPYAAERVYDAFHLLNTEPSVQRMVISLSSDKAIWNAVLNNEEVREFRESINQGAADTNLPGSSEEGAGDDSAKDTLSWIVVNIKARVMEVVDKITKLLHEVFQPSGKIAAEDNVDPFEEKLKASFLLSVVVLLIVVVTRATSVA